MLGLNQFLSAQRRRFAVLVVLLSLATAVVAGHCAMSDEPIGETAAICLAVAATGAGTLVLAGSASVVSNLLRAPAPLLPGAPNPVRRPQPQARAGPTLLQVFRL